MSNFVIGQAWSGATITSTTAAATMPASNLDKPQPTDVWRSTDITGEYIDIDLGAARAVDMIALLFTNLTSAATWRVTAGASAGATTYDSGTVTAWAGATENVDRPHAFLFLSAPQTWRHWRIILTDAANPDGYFEAGRVFLSNAFQGTRNYAYGAGRGFRDLTERADAFGGQLLFETKAKRPVLSFEANWLTQNEMEADVLELQRTLDGPVLAMLSPDANTFRMGRIYYGLLSTEPCILAGFTRVGTRFTVEGLA